MFACFKLSLCAAGRGGACSGFIHFSHCKQVHVKRLRGVSVAHFVFVFQGLFRIAAGASKLKKLKAALDCSTSQLEEFYSDPHAVAGTHYTSVVFKLIIVLENYLTIFSGL